MSATCPDPTGSSRPPLVIRKYPNRRYYDTTRSQHVKLEEIYQLIRDGHNVTVTDTKSGEDITQKVLAQIILEHDPPKLDVFPVELLHRLIRANEQLISDFVEKYFNQALSAFLVSQQQFDHFLRQTVGLGVPARAAANPAAGGWPYPFLPSAFAPTADPAATASDEPAREPSRLREQVEQLTRQVDLLHEKLSDQDEAG